MTSDFVAEWDKLEKLLKAGDMKVFWEAYANYLERNNIISRARMILYVAAKKTSELL